MQSEALIICSLPDERRAPIAVKTIEKIHKEEKLRSRLLI